MEHDEKIKVLSIKHCIGTLLRLNVIWWYRINWILFLQSYYIAVVAIRLIYESSYSVHAKSKLV